jgi:hypothetical protein
VSLGTEALRQVEQPAALLGEVLLGVDAEVDRERAPVGDGVEVGARLGLAPEQEDGIPGGVRLDGVRRPSLPVSSSGTNTSPSRPEAGAPASRIARAARIVAARPPFMSALPRPESIPSRTTGANRPACWAGTTS